MDRNDHFSGDGAASLPAAVSSPPESVPESGASPDPKPLARARGGIMKYLGRAISLAVLVAVIFQIRQIDFRYVWSIIPSSPLFWMVFVLNYMHGVLADLVIFRRLWTIPLSGIVPLLRKQIGSTLLLGYVGEVYFYTWARKHAELTTSPFGAIKDVAILSGVMGNVVTLIALVLAWPLITQTTMGIRSDVVLYSIAFLVASTVIILLFGRRLFSLTKAELGFISVVHLCRIVIGLVLTGLCWHLVLPQVDLVWWVVLSIMSMLLGRLPFISNKDFVFAALAIFLIGHDAEIPALMTMMASLFLATHVGLGLILMLSDLFSTDRT